MHIDINAIIATKTQALSCDNRFCDFSKISDHAWMDTDAIRKRMERLNISQSDLSEALGISPDKVSKVFSGKRQWRGLEYTKVMEYLAASEAGDGHVYALQPDLPTPDPQRDFLQIAIMPSFAGMGSGGNGGRDDEIEYGLVSRRLVEDELRAHPSDLVLIEARGDSMEPDFQHGDQILVDKRDRNPLQPGPFALWDGDGYVIKLVERIPNKRGWYRIFSANDRYTAYEIEETENTIMGRPVWFGRRL